MYGFICKAKLRIDPVRKRIKIQINWIRWNLWMLQGVKRHYFAKIANVLLKIYCYPFEVYYQPYRFHFYYYPNKEFLWKKNINVSRLSKN